ncbi:variant erythrocyte surface antigen-1 family protein [Babesia caballi]|uniref:Variant erythrocyte surface antigen-1 family protein n=1 Tax=Babesia caballi TaxID=5871 RepID=A0AAV4LRU8_BABCB|nr:variant erythrocyte surface antigen-1 family protein [Babesia caballi]
MAAAGGGKSLSDCPSNLKEAIDWVLRVTGKDGQDQSGKGSEAIKALTEQVKRLLNEVKSADPELAAEITKVEESLNGDSQNALIAKLADGLQRFIGYQSGVGNTNGFITGSGIAPSNIATHRLCDATLAFTIGVLESLGKENGIQEKDKKEIATVISELHGAFGKSVNDGLKGVAQSMNTKLNNFTGSDTVIEAVKKVGTAFQSKLSNATDATRALAGEVGGYIDEVVKQVSSVGGGKSKATQISKDLTRLGQELTNDAFNPTEQKIKLQIFSVDVALRYALQPDTLKIISTVKDALTAGANAFTNHLKAKYESAYLNVTKDTNDLKCAKIFLGCLPMVFSALSYLYWRCHENGGGWNGIKVGGDKSGKDDLKDFLYSMAYGSSILSVGKTGQSVSRALEKFEDLKDGMQKAQQAAQQRVEEASNAKPATPPTPAPTATEVKATYPDFLKELRTSGREKLNQQHPFSTLYAMATLYFTGRHIQSADDTKSSPSTIRRMLYFLAALPFSPELEGV